MPTPRPLPRLLFPCNASQTSSRPLSQLLRKPLYASCPHYALSPLPSWSLILWCLALLSNCLCQILFSSSRMLRAHVRAHVSSHQLNSHMGPVQTRTWTERVSNCWAELRHQPTNKQFCLIGCCYLATLSSVLVDLNRENPTLKKWDLPIISLLALCPQTSSSSHHSNHDCPSQQTYLWLLTLPQLHPNTHYRFPTTSTLVTFPQAPGTRL